MLKKVSAALMAVILSAACLGSVSASAAQSVPDASPYNKYACSYSSYLAITGTTARCESEANGYYGETTSIVVNQTLQRKTSSGTWQLIKHWNETDTGFIASVTNYKYGLISGTYRLKTEFTYLTASGFEQVTAYSGERTVA